MFFFILDELNVDRLIKEQDIDLLNSHLNNIVNCNLQNDLYCGDSVKIFNNNFIKLFNIAQLSVIYLSHCRNYLENYVIELEKNNVTLSEVSYFTQLLLCYKI